MLIESDTALPECGDLWWSVAAGTLTTERPRPRRGLVPHAPILGFGYGGGVNGCLLYNLDPGAATKMPPGESTDPIYLSSDSEEDGDIMRGMLDAVAKGKGRATNMVLDADQGVATESQTAGAGGASVPVNGARAFTPAKPSSVTVVGVLPQPLQSSSDRHELHQYSSNDLRNQQGIGRSPQPSATANPALENPANPLGKHV